MCASLLVYDDFKCDVWYFYDNNSTSVHFHACDDILHDFMGDFKIVDDTLLKKNAKKFQKTLRNFVCEKDSLISKLS